MKKSFCWLALICLAIFYCQMPVQAKEASQEKIIFVPHDNRPISDMQTADTVRRLGYDVVVPPDEMLGGRTDLGHPDELWQWLEEKAADKDVKAAVVSSDAMLYGSLVASRKHDYSAEQVRDRADNFAEFRANHPKLKMYVFGSIMRTPRTGDASGSMEPEYYKSYGSDIFRYTALTDKKETEGLTAREQREFNFLQDLIPSKALQDWMYRRSKNFAANKYLIDLTRKKAFDYMVLGRDDNAPYSQTHMESRKLAQYGADVGQSRFQAMAGIDEIGLLLLTRAVNDLKSQVPFVYVRYNWGSGPNTVPSYSDETIANSIRSHIVAAGGLQVQTPVRADLYLLINTNPSGRTFDGNDRTNDGTPREGTKYFADLVSEAVAANQPVGIGDIAYANGADNALMEELKDRGLLFKIQAYAGWNTATNSTGFVLGQGMLAPHMSDADRDRLLLMRYLDDWAYQSNVRPVIGRQLGWLRGTGAYASLDEKRPSVEYRSTKMMRRFAEENLPPFDELQNMQITFPWNRMFEARIDLGD